VSGGSAANTIVEECEPGGRARPMSRKGKDDQLRADVRPRIAPPASRSKPGRPQEGTATGCSTSWCRRMAQRPMNTYPAAQDLMHGDIDATDIASAKIIYSKGYSGIRRTQGGL